MARSFTILLLILVSSLIIAQEVLANAYVRVPAIYIFGDSGVDAGNNNHLNTAAKANKWPYGVDNNNVLGRFTNGKTGIDFSATFLGLPTPPPYLNLSEHERSQITTGINYASGSCGILNTTRNGECLSLGKQIEYFTSTATVDLPKAIKSPENMKKYLAKSIFILLIGSNDYIPALNHGIKNNYSSEGFAQLLVDEMTKYIQELYNLGGRKFLVSNLASCEPHNYTSPFCETMYYADKLHERIDKLRSKLPGSLFSIFNGVNIIKQIHKEPQKYGFKYLDKPCFVEGTLCTNRSEYILYDIYGHLTEAMNRITAINCFNGTSCTPYTLLDLANK